MLSKKLYRSVLKVKQLRTISLLTLALATWWISFSQEPPTLFEEGEQTHKIDYFLKNFNALSMTENGLPKERLQAEYMKHFSDNDTTEMKLPQITMYSEDKPDLQIKSDTGFISSDGELVLLNGAVTIRREAKDKLDPMIVDTHNLRIQLSNDYAETDEYVKIISKGITIEGTGLRAHFRDPIYIKVQSDARGKHAIK
ncbi:MAG: LPS export ABC transporter periplasmic protein LptC [Cycloclasticus sp. symbiont of Poecilosclerida sp. M]|nr:MAG: LPS export ABC transporter periplasmic protein LptC [Cycloclasticus sp. symbiont of Poecilosclerida sp. M]